jgi:hypothetical protein
LHHRPRAAGTAIVTVNLRLRPSKTLGSADVSVVVVISD